MERDIVFSLEYHGWPLWRYGENGLVIDNCTPPEWKHDLELDETLQALQKAYDASFIDENGKEDFYKSHMTDEERVAFRALLKKAKESIERVNNGKHHIEYLS